MAIMNVNPTRMEMNRLQRRLSTASRGHKLLKDKQDELVRQFTKLVKQNQDLRKKMEETLQKGMEDYVLASSRTPDYVLGEAFAIPLDKITLDVQSKNVMNIEMPVLNEIYDDEKSEDRFSYGFMSTTSELDLALNNLSSILPIMLKLAEIEKSCQMMADEIERTRRRVNALEYKMIPQLEDTIAYIEKTLDESERATLTRLMKSIDVIESED